MTGPDAGFSLGASMRPACLALVLLGTLASAASGAETPDEPSRSADEVARELANPNNSLASLTFKNQFRWYEGDLPDADDQHGYTLLFQPVFPFTLEPTERGGKANLFVRPGIPFFVEQPVPRLEYGGIDFDGESGLGDIGFDVMYGVTGRSGLLWALGLVGTLPTATNSDLKGHQLRLGPEFLLARLGKKAVYGIFPSHQWHASGSRYGDYSTTQIQLFATYLPGGGWSVGSTPIMNYDWEADEWTIPLNVTAGRTALSGRTPIKWQVELNYYVKRLDAFAPRWMLGVNITPVVPNVIDRWIRGR